jgi:hypothetical protein
MGEFKNWTSRRYCINCEKETFFKLNKKINRSECMICGFRFAKKTAPCLKQESKE